MNRTFDALNIGRIIAAGIPARARPGIRNAIDHAQVVHFSCGCGILAGELERFPVQPDGFRIRITAEHFAVNLIKFFLHVRLVRVDICPDVIVKIGADAEPPGTFNNIVEIAVAEPVPVEIRQENDDLVIACVKQGQEFRIGKNVDPASRMDGPLLIHRPANGFAERQNRRTFQIHDIFQVDGPTENHAFCGGKTNVLFLCFDHESMFDGRRDLQPEHPRGILMHDPERDTHAFFQIIPEVASRNNSERLCPGGISDRPFAGQHHFIFFRLPGRIPSARLVILPMTLPEIIILFAHGETPVLPYLNYFCLT